MLWIFRSTTSQQFARVNVESESVFMPQNKVMLYLLRSVEWD